MKIAHVEGIHLAIPSRYSGPEPRGVAQCAEVHMLLVRVETESGLVGWGEAFGHMACATTKLALETLVAPLCIGAEAKDIGGLNENVSRALHAYGPRGPALFALSGVDIALWDLRGKIEGSPVHRLLGNTSPPANVPAYASLLRYGDADLIGLAVEDAVARGHRRVKLHEATEAAVAAARAAAGPEIGLMLDVNCRWSRDEAVAIAHRIRPYRLDWIEEPSWPIDPAVIARIAKETGIPIAAGENASSLADLAQLADSGVEFIQPSAAKIGGLTALVNAAEQAKQQGARHAPHSPYFGPALAATIHFCAAADVSCEWYDCRLEANPCGIAPTNGDLETPQGPGLGIAIDPTVVAEYRLP
jgi:L-alanine-DL-glutamate epimerase-like enolase superfamily enzyme